MFDIVGKSYAPPAQPSNNDDVERWWQRLLTTAEARRLELARTQNVSAKDIEALANAAFAEIAQQARAAGIALPAEFLTRLLGELSGLGDLFALIAQPDVEDVAVNQGHIHVYTTSGGWNYVGPAAPGLITALRVQFERAGQRTASPDYPVADATLQLAVPSDAGMHRKILRAVHIMPPASPAGDIITIRTTDYPVVEEHAKHTAAYLTASALPGVERVPFTPRDYPDGRGVLSPAAANYLTAVLVAGGAIIFAGATGAGKTFVARNMLQEMLDAFPRGALRLFIIEETREIVLNDWSGDPEEDTGNIVYTQTRPAIAGGPPPITMYDLIRAALRCRPDGIVIGEARGAEAWEFVRAVGTGHGHSVMTLHASSADEVWPRFLEMVEGSPETRGLSTLQIAQAFARAVTAVVYLERPLNRRQVASQILEVSRNVEPSAERPAFDPLFRYDEERDAIVPTGNRPMRPGFRANELGLPETLFRRPL